MTDETTIITKQDAPAQADTSTLFKVSIRGWLAMMLVATVCAKSMLDGEVKEPLYSLSIGALGFYFGQSMKR